MGDDDEVRLSDRLRDNDDAPYLQAWFPPTQEAFMPAGHRLISLLRNLAGSNRYIEYWRQDRSQAENQSASGIDPLSEPQSYLDFQMSMGRKSDAVFTINAFAFSEVIYPSSPSKHSARLGFSGGTLLKNANTLDFRPARDGNDHNLTLAEWRLVVAAIVNWQLPRFITVGPQNYATYERVFEHRAWPGWMAWFGERIDPEALPEFALTFDIGPGTLVATQETNVVTTDTMQVERATEVEIALGQLDVLPTLNYLIGRSNR